MFFNHQWNLLKSRLFKENKNLEPGQLLSGLDPRSKYPREGGPTLAVEDPQRQRHLHAQPGRRPLQGHPGFRPNPNGFQIFIIVLYIYCDHPGESFLQVDKDGRSSCNFEDCPNSPTANIVQTFAGSNKV